MNHRLTSIVAALTLLTPGSHGLASTVDMQILDWSVYVGTSLPSTTPL